MKREVYLMITFYNQSPEFFQLSEMVANKFLLAIENDSEKEIVLDGKMIDPKSITNVWKRMYNSVK